MVQGKLSQELAVIIGSNRNRGGAGDLNGFNKIEASPNFQMLGW